MKAKFVVREASTERYKELWNLDIL